MSHKEPSPPKKRRPDPEEHLTFFFLPLDPASNVEQATDELAQVAQRDPRIQEALATIRAFLMESLGTSNPEATAGLVDDFGDFDSFSTELAPLFGAAYMRAADTLTGGRGLERFGRRLRQGQRLLDRVRVAVIETDPGFVWQVLAEATRRAGRTQAFRLNLREAAHQADGLIRSKLPEVRFGEPFDAAFHDQPLGEDGPTGLPSAAIAGLVVLTFAMVAAGR
jgi:hypothetical protein